MDELGVVRHRASHGVADADDCAESTGQRDLTRWGPFIAPGLAPRVGLWGCCQ